MQVLSTILPIFAVVILGWFARRRGFMPPEFLGPANQLVYYLAIPALIFRSISKASFDTQFNMTVLLITLSSAVLAYFSAWLIGHSTRWSKGRIGTFIQCSAHGNHGYIGLPVAFYFLGTLVSVIQAYVFTVLSMIYVALAVSHGQGDEHGHAEQH